MKKQYYHIAVIVIITTLILYLNLLTMRWFSNHIVLNELFYVPLILGVMRFGPIGALTTYLSVSAAYLFLFYGSWVASFPQLVDRMLHVVLSGVVAIFAGQLVERERKRHRLVEQERYFSGIGQAATVIVHDLKNPLISIMGFARRIQEGKGDITLAAQTITKSAQTMQRIVKDVLEFAKPVCLNFNESDIRGIVQKACESCLMKAENKRVNLIVNVSTEPLICNNDSFQMERALVNLIDNSVDASCLGGDVIVTIVGGKNILTITIKDNGCGMNQETLDSLFTLTYTTKNEGAGFGVPISKKIIEAHGGTIRIMSKINYGTEVFIDLPLVGLANHFV